MAAIKLSSEMASRQRVTLSGTFINEYLPSAPENFVKVYITGLHLAMTDSECTRETIAAKLFIDAVTVDEAYSYWQDQGLVHVSTDNGEISYLPVVGRARQIRKFSKEKYRTFNDQLHALFPNRNILPTEYNAYYEVMEYYNLEIEAMLTIIGYCKRLKGEDITYPYIVTVARNFAAEGYVTFDKVSEKIGELDLHDKDLKAVVKAVGKKVVDHEDKRLYLKWTVSMGYGTDTIIHVAQSVKKGGMARLDAKLTKYYELHLTSTVEIDNYEKTRDEMYDITKKIVHNLGLWYDNLDHTVESYTVKWINMGFDAATLEKIAEYCYKRGLKTLEAMNDTIKKFYKLGCVSSESIAEFVSEAAKSDEEIKEIFEEAGVSRQISTRDRDYYRTWTYSWNLPRDVILYAAQISKTADNPIAYLNAILAAWHDKGVKTVENAKKQGTVPPASNTKSENRVVVDFSADELNAAFAKLNEDI